jgi:NAD(P)H-dependent flavin oxidoreductase YrpB (nitropropane dioxygenase family)
MTMQTALTRRLGIDQPIVQAPIGNLSNPHLVAAVSNAGGLGMIALTWRDLDASRAAVREIRQLTDRPFGVNLILVWPQEERLRLVLDEGVRIISFFWGDPTPLLPLVHQAGAIAMVTVGSAAEARLAVDAGVDIIVAQGFEAGGHVWGEVSTLALVPAVVDVVGRTPVAAAGGIADGRGLAAVLALGAGGAWMGTRFVASEEAGAHPTYLAMLAAARETDTLHSILFDGGWPDAPHRTLRNPTTDAWLRAGQPARGLRPREGEVLATGPGGDVARYESASIGEGLGGRIDELSLWAGQGVGLIGDVLPAAEIVRKVAEDAEATITRLAGWAWEPGNG